MASHKPRRRVNHKEATAKLRRTFGSEAYLPTTSGRSWLAVPAALERLKLTGLRVPAGYTVKPPSDWRSALLDPSCGTLAGDAATGQGAGLW